MVDNLTKKQRSYTMSRIKNKNTAPEQHLKHILKRLGFVFHPEGIYGHPDFADKKHKIAVFIDGCFWHACPRHFKRPKSNAIYWIIK
jgi:DNA mismatch endonuclease (patch repair protein)